MGNEIRLSGPAAVALTVVVLLLFGVHWFFPGLLPSLLGNVSVSYSLFRSGHVSMAASSGETHIPGFGNRADYESGWIPTFGGEELVITRKVAMDRGEVTVKVWQYDWSLLPQSHWRQEVTRSVNDVVRVPLPEAALYELDVEHWRMNGKLTIDWEVRSAAED